MKFRTFHNSLISEFFITDNDSIERLGIGIMNVSSEDEYAFCPLSIRLEWNRKALFLSTEIFKWIFFIHINSGDLKELEDNELGDNYV